MSTEIDAKVHAELRENFGKGFARRLRAAGQIPAVIYGHGTSPVHVALPGHQVSLLVRRANALLELDIDGKDQLTLVKDVQRDPVRQIIEHIDLLVVKKGEKIHVDANCLSLKNVRQIKNWTWCAHCVQHVKDMAMPTATKKKA